MNKRADAVWRITKDLAERVNAARAAGLIVIDGGQKMNHEIEIDESSRFIAVRHDENCRGVIFDGREDGFGRFETIKEAREYFADNFVVAKPMKLSRIKK